MARLGSLVERFEEAAATTAVVSPGESVTYRELVEAIEGHRSQLARAEVVPGTVVGLDGDFAPGTVAILLALLDAGAVVVPNGLANRLGRDPRYAAAQVELCAREGERRELLLERTGRRASHPLYDELRRRDSAGLVQFTSGTSGEPKAALHDVAALLEKFELRRPALVTLGFLLFDHLGGLNTLFHTLSNGATFVTVPDRSPETVCATIERHGVELLPATPTFLNLMLLSGADRRHDLGSLRVISYGAEPMPAATLARLRERFPEVSLRQTYGMVEIGALRTRSRDDGSLWVEVGGEGFETRVVDGILQVRARSMLMGYLDGPASITADGWLVTGDLVEQDGDYLRFLGRDSDLINVGGEKVHPTEVEGVIESVEGVAGAVVYGEPNDIVGQIVCARVTPLDPLAPDGLARRVKRECRERLERFKVPVRVEVVDPGAAGESVKKERRRR